MSLATFIYRLSMGAALNAAQLVPQNIDLDWLVITAASTGANPQEQNLTVQIAFGNAQPQLYTTPVAFSGMRDRQTGDPFRAGITVTAPAIPGLEVIGQGGLS